MSSNQKKYVSEFEELMLEWDYEKNTNINPNNITHGSNLKVWWRCSKCNGEYMKAISERTCDRKIGCPYCKGRKVLKGFNDFASKFPDLLNLWDYKKNTIAPDEVTYGSHKEVWWYCKKCNKGWFRSVNRMTTQKRCPYCSGKNATSENNFTVTNPELLSEWDYEKNTIKPEEITYGSVKKIWWKCSKCGYSYEARICDRTRKDKTKGCPNCSRNYVLPGKNDLLTLFPEIAKEWDYEKNDRDIKKVGIKSTYKAWWKCSYCGYSWQNFVENRTRGKNGCPKCNKGKHTSFPEYAIYFYLKKVYNDSINSYKDIFDTTMEIDIYIPSLKIGFEYDGNRWHNDKKSLRREKKKYDICKKNNIKLIRIIENDYKEVHLNCDCFIKSDYNSNDYSSIENTIKKVFELLKIDYTFDINKDITEIIGQFTNLKFTNSLKYKFPDIANEWDYEKNKDLTPDKVTCGSSLKVWWICPKCQNSYQKVISARTYRRSGCPVCKQNNVNAEKYLEIETGKIYYGLKEIQKITQYAYTTISQHIIKGKSINGYHYKKMVDKKIIYCCELNKTFKTLDEAAKYIGGSCASISNCLHKKIKSVKGYHFKYIEEDNNK